MAKKPSPNLGSTARSGQADPIQLDLRESEPPQPMIQVLTTLERMNSGDQLVALLPRKPAYLLPQLEEEGHQVTLAQQDDGSWELRLIKK